MKKYVMCAVMGLLGGSMTLNAQEKANLRAHRGTVPL